MILAMIICWGVTCEPHELPLPSRPAWFIGTDQDWCRATRDAWQELNLQYQVQASECVPEGPGEPVELAGQ